jgi:hypothetical protein
MRLHAARGRALVLVAALAVVAAACSSGGGSKQSGSGETSSTSGPVRITPASGRPDMVTGGDTLVRVSGVPAATDVRFEVDGKTASEVSGQRRDGDSVLALVGGLTNGEHRVTAVAGSRRVTFAVRNHPITGPVFSGPHLPLLVCTTEQAGLGKATDRDCSAPPKTAWQYRSTDGRFRPLTVPGPRPADLATTTVDGEQVDEIVRVEEGVIDRAIYTISILDPTALAQPKTFDDRGWNHRLVYEFGGGCGTSYSQGSGLGTPTIDPGLLGAGYAIATATFNTFQVQCNDVLSAETAMMVKEHLAKRYGPPRFTIGTGGSGGAIQQILVAQNYPGILDAISPILPFPDALSIAGGVSDCGLLQRYFRSAAGAGFTNAQQAAVEGHRTIGTCAEWVSSFLGNIFPTTGCDPGIPRSEIYDPKTNPKGLRCTLQDANRYQIGINPHTGFAYRPLDNVGIQYGLQALRAHTITVDQFLRLNEDVGGYDIDGNAVPEREVAELAGVRRAYRDGRIFEGGAVRDIAVIATNVYRDDQGDIHDRFRVFEIRARLGDADANQVIWTVPPGAAIGGSITGATTGALQLVGLLDDWLTTGKRPAAAVDTCTLPDGKKLTGPGVNEHDPACTQAYPSFGDSRTAAGAPVRDDVVKCALKPIDTRDYGDVTFDAAQRARRARIVPKGVCVWTKRSVGYETPRTWVSY